MGYIKGLNRSVFVDVGLNSCYLKCSKCGEIYVDNYVDSDVGSFNFETYTGKFQGVKCPKCGSDEFSVGHMIESIVAIPKKDNE